MYAWMLAALDERIQVAVVNDGYGTLAGDPRPTRWARDSWWIGIPQLRPTLQKREFPFDWHQVLALIAPRALLLMAHRDDAVFPQYWGVLETRRTLLPVFQLWGAENRLAVEVASGTHGFPLSRRRRMFEFLDEHL
jgi:hypothetical protein